MLCPICKSSSHRQFEKDQFWIRECDHCTHRFCELVPDSDHVNRTYADAYFSEGGAGYTDYLSEADILVAHGRRYGRLLSRYVPMGQVLDVGAAAGFILHGMTQSGWRGVGIEPNDRMAEYARSHYQLNVQTDTLESFQTETVFDVVSMIQVVAHLTDLSRSFTRVQQLLRPGGFCLVESWDKDSFPAKLFGSNWHEYSPPSVLHWFSRSTLERLASGCGLQLVDQGKPQKWIDGKHAKGLLQFKLARGPLRLARPLTHLIPTRVCLPYPALDLFWMLFQKQPS